jgi:hypothetical protein
VSEAAISMVERAMVMPTKVRDTVVVFVTAWRQPALLWHFPLAVYSLIVIYASHFREHDRLQTPPRPTTIVFKARVLFDHGAAPVVLSSSSGSRVGQQFQFRVK